MLNPDKKYNLDYYLGVVDKVVSMGAHILGIKVLECRSRERCETIG